MKLYYLAYTFPGSKEVRLAHLPDGKVLAAEEGNQRLLEQMGRDFIQKGLYGTAQVLVSDGSVMGWDRK